MSTLPDVSKPKDNPTSPTTAAPESPTTVRPFDMDDDDVPEPGVLGNPNATAHPASAATTTADEAPPTQPPRPQTTQQQNELMLKEAFPTIDAAVIKAVLIASGGQIDPAFNALLGMSDPDAIKNDAPREQAPPPKPPRPANRTPISQMEADELYARQLAEHYDNVGAYEARTTNRGGPSGPHRRQATGLKPNEMYDREPNFIDDELPVITENIRKGFLETQTKVNSWFTNLKKKIDGEYDSDEDETQPSKHRPHHGFGRRSGEGSRQSTDHHRYDADPQVLSDDFAGMRFNADGRPAQHHAPPNPNVNKPLHTANKPESRKVAFRDSVEDIGPYDASPKIAPKESSTTPPPGKQSKWQPLSTVEPNPIAENDPFSLGDSEDEKESKGGHKEIKMEDSERLKAATADAMADSLVGSSTKAATDGKSA